ncbi:MULTISPECIES: TRAP transporter permease [Oceanimonas]|uniref:TRAP transporter permease n=2 Tax=Aeromonadaceae TaxID=84642 RepID=A0ABW7P1D8_9GAMM|nr:MULTISPECIES: TRAP transporter permease [Oceanimonas]MDV2856373.1 TRAP transporter permease [Oceanimonas sp. CAM02]
MSSNQSRHALIFYGALCFSVFQIITAAFSPLSTTVVRAIHVGFLLFLVYQLYGARGQALSRPSVWGILLGTVAMLFAFYHWWFEADLIYRAGELSQTDWVIGTVTLLMVFDAARRLMGWALPLICLAFVGYALFGEYLPDVLMHRGYGLDQVVSQLAFSTEGIYGTPTYVSSSYIFLFILFGAFLEQAGMLKLFNDVAIGSVGHTRGGPAKVSVLSSGMMGTINGSGVANVVSTGQFTIPLMKKFGYRADFAGAVEATSSMGGQIMPPVMGAVAFIMAETINVPYVDITKAALVPAILYFFTVFLMVHLEAGRAGLNGLPKSECPNPLQALKARWYLLLPLVALVVMLFSGFTPLFAGMMGLALTVVLIMGNGLARHISARGLRYGFWVILGLACATFNHYGITAIFVIVAVLTVLLLAKREQNILSTVVNALYQGALHALPVGVACALVGVIIGVISLTGAATIVAGFIIQLGEHSLLLSLALTMLTCLVLGMGIPTIPNYIITSSIAAPALLELGVPLIVSHMFVFYFGIMADLTPPVALAAFAASPIAKASGLRIGVRSLQIAIAGFVVPYMAVYSPALMLQGDAGLAATVFVIFKALLAVSLWGMGAIGYWLKPFSLAERLLAIAAAALLVFSLPMTDELGLLLAALILARHWWQQRRQLQLNTAS